MKFFITLTLLVFFIPKYCYAYIGPGLAIGGAHINFRHCPFNNFSIRCNIILPDKKND